MYDVTMDYIIESGNDYVAVDQSSGGYPFITENLSMAKIWTKQSEAVEYYNMFRDRAVAERWRLYEIELKRTLCLADCGEFLVDIAS